MKKYRLWVNDARTLLVRQSERAVSVTMQEDGGALTLFFDPDRALTGDAPLLEVRISPPAHGSFEPWRLAPQLPLYLALARAELNLAGDNSEAVWNALRVLSTINKPPRGLSNDFLRVVALAYTSLENEGEPHPITALARMQQVNKSTASRWVSAARARGFLPTERLLLKRMDGFQIKRAAIRVWKADDGLASLGAFDSQENSA